MSVISNFLRRLVLLASLMLGLSGCVQYDTTVNFKSFNAGELVQHVTLDRQFYQLNQSAIDIWLRSIEQRTQKLHGQVQKISERELTVIMPFRTAAELVSKFNQFFASDQQLLGSKLAVTQSNFLVASRHQLTYDLDLRSLAADRQVTKGIADQQANLDLKFALNVPSFSSNHNGRWQLQPGQVNHLSTVFWLPNPIGIGSCAIMLWVAIGYFIKSKLSPITTKS
jgi:Protein of unknown function (DUF3153)